MKAFYNKSILIASTVLTSGTSSVFPDLRGDMEFPAIIYDCNYNNSLNIEINGANNCATFTITSPIVTEVKKNKMIRKVSLNIEKYSEAIRNAPALIEGPFAKESQQKVTSEDYISNMRKSSGKVLPASEKWYL
jgi:hypothetical protein